MKLYLAARYSRKDELLGYRELLIQRGFRVECRWLTMDHDIPTVDVAEDKAAEFAQYDFEDLHNADRVLVFTEEPGFKGPRGRGGRHVELGLALAWGKAVDVIGHRENVFCYLPQVFFFRSFDEWSAKNPKVAA